MPSSLPLSIITNMPLSTTQPCTYPLHLLLRAAVQWGLRKYARFKEHLGIPIWEIIPGNDSGFMDRTQSALDLIAKNDMRRFNRLAVHVGGILHAGRVCLASYQHGLGLCFVNYEAFDFAHSPEKKTIRYAIVLVHEATHAFLHNKRIPYTQRTHRRIEMLCTMEEIRFARRLRMVDVPTEEELWRKVDVDAWAPYWKSTRLQRLWHYLTVLKAEKRKT